MRTVLIAAAMLAAGGAADAQDRMVTPGPGPASGPRPSFRPGAAPGMAGRQPAPGRGVEGMPGQHWGGQYHGHWIGGMRAPGGWGAYRRPRRGAVLPGYWTAPAFAVTEWEAYGLPQPPAGYGWSRYYDDAVLTDGRGGVYDSVGGIDWRRYDLDEAEGGRLDAYYANRDSYHGAGAGYPAPGYPAPGYPGHPGPDGGYGRPGPAFNGGAMAGPPPGTGFPPPTIVRSGGGTIVTTSTAAGVSGGTWVNGYFYPPAAVTTVTVASAPVVTTTTEVFEDDVTYTRPIARAPVVRKAYRRRVWRRAPSCYCR